MTLINKLSWFLRYTILSGVCHNRLMVEVSDREQINAIREWFEQQRCNYIYIEQKYQNQQNETFATQRILTLYFARRRTATSFQLAFKGDANILEERFPFKRGENAGR